MKTTIILLTTFVCITVNANAQIPNHGFEDWYTVGNCIEPTSWHSFYSLFDTTGSYCPVTRSTDHFPESIGSYSVRIANDTTIWNTGVEPGRFLGWGMLLSTKLDDKPLFPITGHPTSLCGYYKFLPENGDTMTINIFLSDNGSDVSAGHLKSNIPAADWTAFNIPLSSYTAADSARITLSAAAEPKNGVGVRGNSVLYVDNLSFDILITSVTDKPADGIPGTFYLGQNFPNPFNPSTSISFDIPWAVNVKMDIFDITGYTIRTLLDEPKVAGSFEVVWNGTDDTGNTVASGLYIYRIQAGDFVQSKKLLFFK